MNVPKILDPVFGELEFSNGWVGEVFVPFLDASFELTINNSLEYPPAEAEHLAWQQFLQRQPDMKQAVTRALADYYSAHLEQFRMPYTAQEEALYAPTLTQPEQIWTLIKPLRWLWMELGYDDEQVAISFEFCPKWDEEHGLSLVFYNDQLGVSDGGAHWLDQDHYDLNGQRLPA